VDLHTLNPLKMSKTSTHNPAGMASRTRVARPDLYYGERSKLEDWLLQFDLFFKFEDDVDDNNKAPLMASYLRGSAAVWVKPFLIKYMSSNNSKERITQMFEDHDEFKVQLRQTFGIINEKSNADRAIQHLRQTRSAADYAALFQQQAIQTDWNDQALMVMYRQGLKDNVKAELMRSGVFNFTLRDLIEESIRLDNGLYELYLETRSRRTPQPLQKRRQENRFPHNRNNHFAPERAQPPAVTDWHDPDAMQLDNLNKNPPRNEYGTKKRGTAPRTITCYGCGKEGHIARDCRSKNKVTRQINMLFKEERTAISPPSRVPAGQNPFLG